MSCVSVAVEGRVEESSSICLRRFIVNNSSQSLPGKALRWADTTCVFLSTLTLTLQKFWLILSVVFLIA